MVCGNDDYSTSCKAVPTSQAVCYAGDSIATCKQGVWFKGTRKTPFNCMVVIHMCEVEKQELMIVFSLKASLRFHLR